MLNTDSNTIAWKCWYANLADTDFTEYNSVDHTLDDLPETGFQAMRLWFANGTGRYINGNDNYFFVNTSNGLLFGQTDGSADSILQTHPDSLVKSGVTISDALMDTILETQISTTKP